MQITRKNYEMFALDYMEGNLSDKTLMEFKKFLDNNPDIKKEIEMFDPISIENVEEINWDKTRLYKSYGSVTEINENNFSEHYIALKENELDEDLSIRVHNYLEDNEQAQKEAKILDLTFLQPDLSVTFNKKRKLRKSSMTVSIAQFSIAASIAASLILGIVFWPASSSITEQITPLAQSAATTKMERVDLTKIAKKLPSVIALEPNASLSTEKLLITYEPIPSKKMVIINRIYPKNEQLHFVYDVPDLSF